MVKGSLTGGVKPMSITGRYTSERERLLGMTDAERDFRKQWLKDQELCPEEPRQLPEMYKARYNPIRRFYRLPLDIATNVVRPVIGKENSLWFRYFSGKLLMGIAAAYITTYYFKYNMNDWTRKGGWKVIQSRPAVVEGDEGYPKASDRSAPADYASRGFKDLKLNL